MVKEEAMAAAGNPVKRLISSSKTYVVGAAVLCIAALHLYGDLPAEKAADYVLWLTLGLLGFNTAEDVAAKRKG
jgi:hypothetical protein